MEPNSPVSIDSSTPLYEQVEILWKLVETQRAVILRLRSEIGRLTNELNSLSASTSTELLPAPPPPNGFSGDEDDIKHSHGRATIGRVMPQLAPMLLPAESRSTSSRKSTEPIANRPPSAVVATVADNETWNHAASVLLSLTSRPTLAQLLLLGPAPNLLNLAVPRLYTRLESPTGGPGVSSIARSLSSPTYSSARHQGATNAMATTDRLSNAKLAKETTYFMISASLQDPNNTNFNPPLWFITKNYIQLSALETQCRAILRSEPSISTSNMQRLPEKAFFFPIATAADNNASASSLADGKNSPRSTSDTVIEENNITYIAFVSPNQPAASEARCIAIESFLKSLTAILCEASSTPILAILCDFLCSNIIVQDQSIASTDSLVSASSSAANERQQTRLPQPQTHEFKASLVHRSSISSSTSSASRTQKEPEKPFDSGRTRPQQSNTLNLQLSQPFNSTLPPLPRDQKNHVMLPQRNESSTSVSSNLLISDQLEQSNPPLSQQQNSTLASWASNSFSSSASSISYNTGDTPVTSVAPESGFAKLIKMASKWGSSPNTTSTSVATTQSPPNPGSATNAHRVFGVPLVNALRFSEKSGLPAVVYRCIEYLNAKLAHEEEGIYRLSGSSAVMLNLKAKYDTVPDYNLLEVECEGGGGPIKPSDIEVHVVAGLLKLYLRELPASLFPFDIGDVTDAPSDASAVSLLAQHVANLPGANRILLRTLMAHLHGVVANANVNRMTVRNIAIVFSPTMQTPIPAFVHMVSHFETIFGASPSAYAVPLASAGVSANRNNNANISCSVLAETASEKSDTRSVQSCTAVVDGRRAAEGSNSNYPVGRAELTAVSATSAATSSSPSPANSGFGSRQLAEAAAAIVKKRAADYGAKEQPDWLSKQLLPVPLRQNGSAASIGGGIGNTGGDGGGGRGNGGGAAHHNQQQQQQHVISPASAESPTVVAGTASPMVLPKRAMNAVPRITLNFDADGLGPFDFLDHAKRNHHPAPGETPRGAVQSSGISTSSVGGSTGASHPRVLPPLPNPASRPHSADLEPGLPQRLSVTSTGPLAIPHARPQTQHSQQIRRKTDANQEPVTSVAPSVAKLAATATKPRYVLPPRGASRNAATGKQGPGGAAAVPETSDEASARQQLQWLLHVDEKTLSEEVGKLDAQQMEQLRRLMLDQARAVPPPPSAG